MAGQAGPLRGRGRPGGVGTRGAAPASWWEVGAWGPALQTKCPSPWPQERELPPPPASPGSGSCPWRQASCYRQPDLAPHITAWSRALGAAAGPGVLSLPAPQAREPWGLAEEREGTAPKGSTAVPCRDPLWGPTPSPRWQQMRKRARGWGRLRPTSPRTGARHYTIAALPSPAWARGPSPLGRCWTSGPGRPGGGAPVLLPPGCHLLHAGHAVAGAGGRSKPTRVKSGPPQSRGDRAPGELSGPNKIITKRGRQVRWLSKVGGWSAGWASPGAGSQPQLPRCDTPATAVCRAPRT